MLIGLVAMTLAMQSVLLYKQYRPGRSSSKPESITAAPEGTVVDLADLPFQGNAEAGLVLIQFSDYECPFCARHAAGVAKRLDEEYVKTGKIRHAFANNPLPMHPHATLLATAAICAGEQGKYWQMHDALFEANPRSNSEIAALLPKVFLNATKFQRCLESNPNAAKKIAKEAEMAKNLGLTGTPGFALGRADARGQVHVEKLIRGAVGLEVFQKVISDALGAPPQ